ncbi:hypothetical protein [Pseudoxanthomonas sp.]|uniref:hypothetical protein n=1 Tax=Pseudoxanthomonas sp. TaxID=1871049 RepID=UPI0031F2F134
MRAAIASTLARYSRARAARWRPSLHSRRAAEGMSSGRVSGSTSSSTWAAAGALRRAARPLPRSQGSQCRAVSASTSSSTPSRIHNPHSAPSATRPANASSQAGRSTLRSFGVAGFFGFHSTSVRLPPISGSS